MYDHETLPEAAERTVTPEEAALRFLKAYWAADLPAALAACVRGATMMMPRSAPIASPAPVADVLPQIFDTIYTRFVDRRFQITVDRILSAGTTVFVEYTAQGDLVGGDRFECQYLTVIEIQDGRVARLKPFTDTQYVTEKLLSRVADTR